MPFVHPDPASPKQRKRRAYNARHPVRMAFGVLLWLTAIAMVPDLLLGNDVWWVPVATALTLWALSLGMLVLVVRNDRASDWYAEWKAERKAAGEGI